MPKQESLKELCSILKKKMQKSPERKRLLDAVTAVERYTADLRKKDRFGRIPYVTAEQQKRLLELHQAVRQAADNILSGPESNHIKGLVRRFAGLASQNYALLAGYDPQKTPKSLASIEEEVRALKLDLRGGGKLQQYHVGGENRQVISFVNEKGVTVTGFFTPSTKLSPWSQVSKAFADMAENTPKLTDEGKEYLRSFMTALSGPEQLGGPERNKNEALRELIQFCVTSRDEKIVVSPELLAEKMGQVLGKEAKIIQNQVGVNNLQILADMLITHRGMVEDQLGDAAIPEDARLDTRAAAVSAVADLLGCSRVIARARPMVLVDKNGQEIQGTFTAAGAVHPDNIPPVQGIGYANVRSMSAEHGTTYRDVADLQVVDFLVGYPNRSRNRMYYSFDDEMNVTSVQGVHNEDAFGLLVPKHGKLNGKLTLPENMRVMSRATYERIAALDPATLKYALRGFGLSDAELDAAGERLTYLKKVLQKSMSFYEEHAVEYEVEQPILGDREAPGNDLLRQMQPREDSLKSDLSEEEINTNLNPGNAAMREEDSDLSEFSFSEDGGDELGGELIEGELKLADGQIRVLEEEQFRHLTRNSLVLLVDKETGQRQAAGKKMGNAVGGNTFYEVYDQMVNMKEHYNPRQYRDPAREETLVGNQNRCVPEHLQADAVEANRLSLNLSRRENDRLFHSSGKYRDLKRAVDAYAQYSRKLWERVNMAGNPALRALPDYRLDLEAVVRPKELKKLQKLGAEMEKAAERYLIGKGILPEKPGRQPKRSYESYDNQIYTQNRIFFAQQALSLGRRDGRVRPEEVDAAQVNERQAKENLARRLGDEMERKYNRKHGIAQPVPKEEPLIKL